MTKVDIQNSKSTTVARASRTPIELALFTVKTHLAAGDWLSPGISSENFRKDLEDAAKDEQINYEDLTEYIACCAVHHCCDGWAFLGRAMLALAIGDWATANHIGYFAELRAALSLLAAEGIGIFDKTHFVMDDNEGCWSIERPGTHEIAWAALQLWSKQPGAEELLLKIVTPGGIQLGDWLGSLPAGRARPGQVASTWLSTWGIDPGNVDKDHHARNIASYYPTGMSLPNHIVADQACRFIVRLWTILDPQSGFAFEILDRYLLRVVLETEFRRQFGTDRRKQRRYKAWIDACLNALEPRLAKGTASWQDFLLRKSEPDDPEVLVLAKNEVESASVLSRASLLLRLSIGACSRLLTDAGISKSDLEFWWRPWGQGRGLWPPGGEPTDFTELWTDVRDALQVVDGWSNAGGGIRSYSEVRESLAMEMVTLGSAERIALWGLGL